MILAGDIGGTKSNLAIFEEQGAFLRLVFQRRYATSGFSHFEQLIDRFAQECASNTGIALGKITAAGFGVAGAVIDGRLLANNIPWALTTAALARKLNLDIDRLRLLNDLVATAYGVDKLAPQDFLVLTEGRPDPKGNRALIAAGTGLGEATIYWDGRQHRAFPSEGGSTDFAPRTDREIRLLQFLKKDLPRVSCEDVFSGRGFRKLHEFLDPTVLHSTFGEPAGASAAEITENAFSATCPVCTEVLDWWIDAFGAEAGNLALRVLAYGGVYLAGGIAVRILPKLKQSNFCRSFADKGPMTQLLVRIPISVILNEDAPLLGAAHQAMISTGKVEYVEP
jgi:glucokinase